MERKGENQNKDLGREAAGRRWALRRCFGLEPGFQAFAKSFRSGITSPCHPKIYVLDQLADGLPDHRPAGPIVYGQNRLAPVPDLRFQNQHCASPRFPLVQLRRHRNDALGIP